MELDERTIVTAFEILSSRQKTADGKPKRRTLMSSEALEAGSG